MKKRRVDVFVIRFDPSIERLCIILGMKFFYEKGELFVDETPNSDETLRSISKVKFSNDGSLFNFSAVIKKKETDFLIQMDNEWDKQICLFLKDIYYNGFATNSLDNNQLEIIFNEEKDDFKCLIFKDITKPTTKSLLFIKNGITKQWKYMRPGIGGNYVLSSVKITNKTITCNCNEGKDIFHWEMELQPILVSLVGNTLRERLLFENLLVE